MSKFSQFEPSAALNRFLNHLPSDVASSFTTEQLMAIQSTLQRQKHLIDIRCSIPLLWTKFYIVFLMGPERRSSARIRLERNQYPIWTTANILFLVGFISLSILLMFGLFNLKLAAFERLSQPTVHPASIPFKLTQAECENSGRLWHNEECIDYDHSPTF